MSVRNMNPVTEGDKYDLESAFQGAEALAKIQEAVADGKRVAAEMVEKSRGESAEIVEKARLSVGLELASARKQLQQDVVNLTIAATEKLLREKIESGKDRDLVASFVAEMEKEG